MLACCLLMMLAGCATSGDVPIPPHRPLPPLAAADKEPCHDPGVKDGAIAQSELATNRLALADCKRRHGRVVEQYQDAEERSNQ